MPDLMHNPADTRRPDEPKPLHIALLGAVGSGKTRLASELRASLANHDSAAAELLIADGPALASLLPAPGNPMADRQARAHLLLMGLDLPAPVDMQPSQAAADLDLRQTLGRAGVPYSVIYGLGPARLRNALDALHLAAPIAFLPEAGASDRQRPWVWVCDTCSDPVCEHRLLSSLLAERNA